jgi:hypothetical protein
MSQQSKSPFYVIPNFISPLMCEEIVDQLDFIVPDVDTSGKFVPSTKTNDDYEAYLFERFEKYKDSIAAYYDSNHRATSQFTFTWYPVGSKEAMHSENSMYHEGKWMRIKDRDITCVLFLSDYQDKPPFDDEYEVYGGKLEFPQHGFGFNPQRGTLIAFPSVPSFINGIAPILAGSLYIVKFHFAAQVPLMYNPSKFPGNYVTWLREFA